MLIDALIVKNNKPIVFKCDTSCPYFHDHCCCAGKKAFRGILIEPGMLCPLLPKEGGVFLAEDSDNRSGR